jgi:hypothetical protein
MRFEVSDRIRTTKTKNEILDALEEQFRKVSLSIRRSNQTIEAKSIEATFGSVNRTDRTIVSLRQVPDGWVMVANVDYHPSQWFWILLVLLIFTYFGWVFPIAFYLLHKKNVRSAIEDCFQRVKVELDNPTYNEESSFGALEKLASLRDKGIVTEAEFQAKKKQILGS